MKTMNVTRRSFLESAAVLTSAMPGGRQRPPNFVFLLGDDHRWDALGCMGNPIVQTPQLDRLSSEGLTFENHFTTTAICCVSRASIFLSQYASVHNIHDFVKPFSDTQVRRLYPVMLRQAGYHIGFVGKFGVGNTMPSQEFDYWRGFPGQGDYFPHGPRGPHLTDIERDQAVEFLETSPRDRPFCLSVSFKAPHVQDQDPRQYLPSPGAIPLYRNVHIPEPRGAEADDIFRFPEAIQHSENRRRWGVRFSTPDLYQASMKGYYGLISGIDQALGAIRETLSRLGLAEQTVIVYSADHGIFNGEHGFAGKWYMHEESIRMPLIIYDPRQPSATRGSRRTAMTLNIDLPATVLDLAGVVPPPAYQGRSLVPLLSTNVPNWRSLWFYEHHFPYNGWIPSSEGIRTQRWKYVQYTDEASPFEELYDLSSDPHEVRNLRAQPEFQAQARALSRYHKRWKDSLEAWDGASPWTDPVQQADLASDGLL